jgi:hypothetical protein
MRAGSAEGGRGRRAPHHAARITQGQEQLQLLVRAREGATTSQYIAARKTRAPAPPSKVHARAHQPATPVGAYTQGVSLGAGQPRRGD